MPMRERYFDRKLTLDEKLYIAELLAVAEHDPEFHPTKDMRVEESKTDTANESEDL